MDDSNINDQEAGEWQPEEINEFRGFTRLKHQNTSVLNVTRKKEVGPVYR